jgi:diaminopimelate decarboxylase
MDVDEREQARTAGSASESAAAATQAPDWWVRPGLQVIDGRLAVASRDVAELAAHLGTPLFLVDLGHVVEQVRRVQAALAGTGLPHKVRFALKAQRETEVLQVLRGLGDARSPGSIGVDVCSPAEVDWALRHGWTAPEISYTGTNLSDTDLSAILPHPIQLNVDLPSQLRRVGRLAPGRSVGLRINPRVGAARHYVPAGRSPDDELQFGMYASRRPTKFGFYPEQLAEAVAIARENDLRINAVHFHICHQTQTEQLEQLDAALAEIVPMIRQLMEAGCPIEEINTGGGLGQAIRQGERDLDLSAWAAILKRHLGPLGIAIATEPGEFLFARSAVLVAEAVTVEDRLGETFVGLNVGWNTMGLRFIWGEAVELVPVVDPLAPRARTVTIAGHINEAPDLFAERYPFPPVAEGDLLALMSVGSYCQAAANQHCLRPPAPAVYLRDRLPR